MYAIYCVYNLTVPPLEVENEIELCTLSMP